MELVNEYVRLFYFSSRKTTLVIALTVTLFLSISAFTLNKKHPNPFEGILGENVTLEWNFTLTSAETFHYFALLEDGRYDMIIYTESKGASTYDSYTGRVALARNGTPSFTLINLTSGNNGKEYCLKVSTQLKEYPAKTHLDCTRLKILVRPAIMSISKNQTVNETNDVKLTCTATGTPEPNVTWSKAGNENHTLSSNSFFTMTNISREQDGLYWCTADNGLSKAVASTRITVQYAPSIIVSSKRYNVTEGNDVHLECLVSDGRPPPTVTWSKNGGLSNITYPPGERLAIKNANRAEAGTYKCTADNGIGKPATATIDVDVFYAPSIDFQSKRFNVSEGEDVQLECVSDGRPFPTVTWSKIGGRSNVTYPPGQRLTIRNASRTEDGTYMCTASNGIGRQATATIVVNVFYAPSIVLSSKRYNVTEGDDMHLQCITNGRPSPTVTWSKIGKLSNITYPPGQRLTIKNSYRTEAGIYTCTASNGIGKLATATMVVNVFYPPSIEGAPNNQTLNETQDLRLQCSATGNPQPFITWSKLRPNPGRIDSVDGVLIVNNVNKTSSGVYQCRASNGIGSDTIALSTVTVNYKPRDTSLTSNVTRNTVIEGMPVTFTCSADSAPSPLYELRFKGVSLGNSSDGVFTIQRVRASDQGIYDCVPRNILGIGQMATLSLTVLVPPLIGFVSHNATANETDDVVLFCNATGNPRPNITWKFLNGPEKSVIRIGENHTLTNVTRNQAGTYQCIATNNVLDTKTANVYIVINYKPEIKDGASREILSWINHETEVRCEAKGVPLPDITWSHDGEVTSFTQNKSRVSTFKFTPKEQKDFRSYECTASNLLGSTKQKITIVMLVKPQAPIILRIEPGFDYLKIHWKASVTNSAALVLDYLVQVQDKHEPQGWKNCTLISKSLMCTINDLKSNTVYVVRAAGRNVVGYSEFTVIETQTLATDEEGGHKVKPQAPIILRIERGFDYLKIHWKASVTNSAALILDYLVQVQEKHEPEGWRNCTQISKSLMCTINDLKSNTVYVVRVAGRNVVGYSEFTVKETQTLATNEEDEPKDVGKTEKQQQALPRYTVDAIIGGVIGFTGLVVMIVAILSEKLKCRQGQLTINEVESPKEEATGHANKAFAENPVNDLEAEEQV